MLRKRVILLKLLSLRSGTYPPTPRGGSTRDFPDCQKYPFFRPRSAPKCPFFSPAARSFMRDNAQIYSQKSKYSIAPSADSLPRQIDKMFTLSVGKYTTVLFLYFRSPSNTRCFHFLVWNNSVKESDRIQNTAFHSSNLRGSFKQAIRCS